MKVLMAMNNCTGKTAKTTVTVSVKMTLRYPPLMLFSLTTIKVTTGRLKNTKKPLTILIIAVFTTRFKGLISGRAGVSVVIAPFIAVYIKILLSLKYTPTVKTTTDAMKATVV